MAEQGQGYWGLPIESETLDQINKRGEIYGKEHKTSEELMYINSNEPWVLFRSGVNLTGGEPSQCGSKLAEQYVLTGGTLSANENSFKVRAGINYTDQNRTKGAYNSTGYDNRYNLGVRPMSGITSVKIVPKDTWGFIYEAEVSFSVWSVEDLEAINKLYFRPGFVVLLEWGHSIYVDNDGKIKYAGSNLVDVVSPISNRVWFGGTYNSPLVKRANPLDYFENEIKKQRDKTFGNYDGMCGLVVNYSYNFQKNGEWKCTVKIISRGAKTVSTVIDNTRNLTETDDTDLSGHTIFHQIYRNLTKNKVDLVKLGNYVISFKDPTPNLLTSRPSFEISPNTFNIDWKAKTNTVESNTKMRVKWNTLRGYTRSTKDTLFKDEDFPVLSIKTSDKDNLYYIRLFDILNIIQLDRDNFDLDIAKLDTTSGQQGFDLKTGYRYAGFGEIEDLIKKDFTQGMCYSINPFEVMLPVLDKFVPTVSKDAYKDYPEISTIESSSVIGNTFINLESILKLLSQSSQENGNKCSSGKFLTLLLSTIQDDLGNIPDLGLWEDPKHAGVVAIVDRNHISINDDLKEICVTGLRSTVESLDITSDITDNLANMMSVAAQAPGGTAPGNLIRWNNGLEDRFAEKNAFIKEDPLNFDFKKALEQYKANQEALSQSREFSTLYKKFWSNDTDPDLEQKFINQKSYVSSVYAQTFKGSINGVIPVKLNLTMKGISKFYIGTCFKIEPGLLPKDYDNWGYIVTGLEHNISKSGWKTTVNTQYCPPGAKL